MARLGRNM